MSDVGTGEPEAVFRLIYRSDSLIDPDARRSELGSIFTAARRNNRRLGVTGALMISDGAFVQALEGAESVVRELYAAIGEDARHEHLSVVEEAVVAGRTFGRWAMAKVATDGGSDIQLLSNATRGVIVATRRTDPSITPEQEAVLASMRSSLARIA